MRKVDIRKRWYSISNRSDYGLSINYHHGFYFDKQAKFSIGALGWSLFINLPWAVKRAGEECEWPSYGFGFSNHQLILRCGNKPYFINLIGYRELHSLSYLCKDRKTWVEVKDKLSFPKKERKDQFIKELPYSYTLKNGTVQNVKATITVEKREFRLWWAMAVPLFRDIKTSIAVSFDGEIGEGSGSWKGGVFGCSHPLKNNQTPEQALQDMQDTRRFNR